MSVHRLLTGSRRRRRALAIVGGVLGAEALWFISEGLLGIRLQASAGSGYPQPVDIGPGMVAVASVLLPLIGWAALASLERFTTRAAAIWLGFSLLALIGSFAIPLSGSGVPAADRIVLVLMHLTVAACVLPVLYRTSPLVERPSAHQQMTLGAAA